MKDHNHFDNKMAGFQTGIVDMTFEQAEQLYYDRRAEAIDDYNYINPNRYKYTDPRMYEAAMRKVQRDNRTMGGLQRIIPLHNGQEEITFDRNGKRYNIVEYPRGGEVVSLTDYDRMYVVEGRFSLDDPFVKLKNTESYVSIISLVKYRVPHVFGHREENWLYLTGNTGILKGNYMLTSGYKTMITGDMFRDPVYSKLGMDMYQHPPSQTLSIIRPARPSDATVYTDDLRSSHYRPLDPDELPPSVEFRNEELFQMLLFIG